MAVALNLLLNPLEMSLSWNCDKGGGMLEFIVAEWLQGHSKGDK